MNPNIKKAVGSLAFIAALAALPPQLLAQAAPAAPAAGAAEEPKKDEETIVLSPFEVVEDTKGYFSANTMSGTRFNTKLEDLGSSVTVMTKEQMSDFGMTDINDIFAHVAGAEGTGSYTDYVMDRNGQLTDNVQMNPQGANRLRGISSANISYGNYETMGRMPIDPLIIDGVEISRGPNANVFGLGNSAGTVNQVPFSANMSKNSGKAEFRMDSYDGWRATLNINRVLLKNKLAFRINGGRMHEGFIRKPSGVDTRRINAALKFQPFANTRISAAYLHYQMSGNRPNYTPPRDYVSDWISSGKPTWDPVAQLYHLNGQTYGMSADGKSVVAGSSKPITSDTYLHYSLSRAGAIQSRSNIYVDRGVGVGYWTSPGTTDPNFNVTIPNGIVTPIGYTDATAKKGNSQTVRLLQSGLNLGTTGASPGRYTDPSKVLWTTTPTVSSKDIYDWSEVNLSSVNRLKDTTNILMADVDQRFFQTERQTLTAQIGFLHEDSKRYQYTPIGNSGMSGQSGQLFVDVNEKNIDGTPNPYLGRTYIGVAEPLAKWMPQTWDTYRSQIAYKLDFANDKGWTKWLGTHQVSGYHEYKNRVNRVNSARDVLLSDHSWTATGMPGFASNQARGNQSNVTNGPQAGAGLVRGYFRYYVGDSSGTNVDYAPADYSAGAYPFVWGGYTIASGVPVAGSGKFNYTNATLAQVDTTDSSGGNNNSHTIIKTYGGVMQSFWLKNALVTTFGLRNDEVWTMNGVLQTNLLNNNTVYDFETNNQWSGTWRRSEGRTKTGGAVLKPFRNFSFVQGGRESGSTLSRFFHEVLNGLSVTYNKSDNFIPQGPAVDLYFNELPNVTGEGTDKGLWLNLWDNKLVIRYNKWETKQLNARDGDANTVAQRVLRLDLDVSSDNYQLYDRATAWTALKNPTWSPEAVRASVADQMKISVERYDQLMNNFRAGMIAATNDITAKGQELELNYNPSKFWTIAGSVTETQSITTNVSPAIQKWIDERMPVWTSIVDLNTDPTLGTGANQGWVADAANPKHLWWLHSYSGSQTPLQNYNTFVNAPYSVIKQQEGKSKPSVRKYAAKFSTSYKLAGITSHRYLKNVRVGGSARWEDRGAIGYYVSDTDYTKLNADRPIWDKEHYYFDMFIGYSTRLFRDKIGASVQLNVENIQEGGRLQPIGAFPDGTPNAYRIVDPRKYKLTVAFDF